MLGRLIDVAAAESNNSGASFGLDFGKMLAGHITSGFWITVSYLLLFAAANVVRYRHPRTDTMIAGAAPAPASTHVTLVP